MNINNKKNTNNKQQRKYKLNFRPNMGNGELTSRYA